MRPCCQPPIWGAGGWWANPTAVGFNVSYLVSWQTPYQVGVERDHGGLTGHSGFRGDRVSRGQTGCFPLRFCLEEVASGGYEEETTGEQSLHARRFPSMASRRSLLILV